MTDYTVSRVAMVDCQIRPSDVTKFPILDAMLNVPREVFVPANMRSVAYAGDHVDLGAGRVVLDPRVLAKMLDAVNVQPQEMVLVLGCGLGYGTAVVASMADFVVGVEQDSAMAQEAEANLTAQSVDNAIVVEGPLADGAAKHGPYDVVIVEGGAETVPEKILEQLKEGGRITSIEMHGAAGQCRVGTKVFGKVAWQSAFDATAPVLSGFESNREFVL